MSNTRAAKAKKSGVFKPDNTLQLQQGKDETAGHAMARTLLDPELRHSFTASKFASDLMSGREELPGVMDFYRYVQSAGEKAAAGDLALLSRLLTAQALTLDSMFSELARRAQLNLGEYLNASERYARLALKSQSNCRATIEALAKLHTPREQTVRHVHVNEGGQAVIADEFHNHQGGAVNDQSVKQSHATGAAGTSAPLLGSDSQGFGLPSASREGEATVSDARRH